MQLQGIFVLWQVQNKQGKEHKCVILKCLCTSIWPCFSIYDSKQQNVSTAAEKMCIML